MKTILKTITTLEINALNTNDEIILDVVLPTNITNAKIYPRAMRIINGSGAELGYTIIQNSDELVEKATNPEWFTPIPIGEGTLDVSLTAHCEKVIVTQLNDESTATDDIILYFTNYQAY